MGEAKRRGTVAERVAQAQRPTFCQMITAVAGNASGTSRQNRLAVKMMCQAFAMAGDQIWTDPKMTEGQWGMTVTAEQYWNFVEWYRGEDAEEYILGNPKRLLPFVPIRGDVQLYNLCPTHHMITEDTDGWKIQQTVMSSMIYWIDSLSKTDPDWPLLQYSVLVDETLMGTDRHRESVHQATIANVGPFRLVMLETGQHTQLTLKDNPDWADYAGIDSVKQ